MLGMLQAPPGLGPRIQLSLSLSTQIKSSAAIPNAQYWQNVVACMRFFFISDKYPIYEVLG